METIVSAGFVLAMMAFGLSACQSVQSPAPTSAPVAAAPPPEPAAGVAPPEPPAATLTPERVAAATPPSEPGTGAAPRRAGAARPGDQENTLYMDLKGGRVVIRLRPDLAPQHVERIKTLVREGFYDGIVFHRVIDGFMAQTGDPTGTGGGGSSYPDLPAEFSSEPFVRGTIGMARTSDPDSANSQFFIGFEPSPFLNGKYTVWGEVVDGMEHVDAIARGEPPASPDRIVEMHVAGDVEG